MSRFRILFLVCLSTFSSVLADRTLLQVDFARPAWRELLPEQRGKISVAGHAAVLPPGSSMNTAIFPYRAGQKVTVAVESRCYNVKPGKNGWDICWATITGFGADKKELCHQDIILVGGTQPWKNYVCSYDFNDQVKYFQVNLNHAGSKGKVWYKNLSISIKDPDQPVEMIGDAGFAGTLNADHWYFVQNSKDWDDLDTWAPGSEAKHDERIFVVGPRGLHLTGPATVVSKAFPYHGETLILSAWMRSKDIKAGKTGWAGAGIQFVGLDKDGKQFCHHDMDILFGTNPWRYCTGDSYTFPAAVKSVQVWIRQFDGAKGESWFDEVHLARVPLGDQQPFDARQAKVSVDIAKPGDVIKHRVWAGIDTGVTIGWWKLDDIRQTMPFLVKAGFSLIRNHEVINGVDLYTHDDEKGNPVYDWTTFDSIHDLYKKNGIVPIVTLETTPQALDKPGVRRPDYHNIGAPKDMVKWGKMVEAIFEHVLDRYGKEYTEQWLWEVWNEPGLPSGYYNGTLEEFLAITEQTYLAAQRVEKRRGVDLKMGLTSGGGGALEHPMLQLLQKKGMLGMVDHFSMHIYAGGSSSIRMFKEALDHIRDYEKSYPGLKFKQVGCTEWNCNSMESDLFQQPWNATYIVKAVRLMLDGGLDYATYFGLSDHPEVIPPTAPLFQSSMGLFTRNNLPIPKPGYNGFVFLNELKGGKRVKLATSNDPIDGIAVLMPDGAVRIVLTSYDEDTARQPYQTDVYVQLQGLPGTQYTCTRLWAADEKNGNTYGEWLKMGKPAYTDDAAKRKLQKAIQYGVLAPPEIQPGPDGTLELKIKVPSPGIRFLEIAPRK